MSTPSVLLGGNFCTQISLRIQNERLQPWIKGLEVIPIPQVYHSLMLDNWITHHELLSGYFKWVRWSASSCMQEGGGGLGVY